MFAALGALGMGCASGDASGDDDDDTVDDAGPAFDAAPPLPDAGEPAQTCEACTANHQCADDHVCATIGDTRACVPACSESDPSCPDGFMCGGIKMTFCAPVDGLCCIDGDDDTFGTGVDCAGPDCNDENPDVNPDADDICNGFDDDCDPATDDGSTDPAVGVDCDGPDTDRCEEGVTYCDGGNLLCDDTTDDVLDLCDGMDNDCNTATLDGSDDPAFGTACDSPGDPDLCFDDQNICDSIAGMIVCQDLAGGALDLCDGLDNDCNPATDDGDGDPAVGVACDGADSDLCEEGSTFCSGGAILCGDTTGDNPEICNGFDDDCNPSTSDGSGDPDVGVMCDGSDTDFCEEGTTICSSGVEICTDTTGNDTEICNGLDDDCDGIPDDIVPSAVCPTQHPGADNVSSWACTGMCEISSCIADFVDVDTDIDNGCECGPVDNFGGSCGSATLVTVPFGGSIMRTGYLPVAGEEDFFRIRFESTPGIGTRWHPSIHLDDPSGTMIMDVRTTSCSNVTCSSGNGSGITDWQVDYTYPGSMPSDSTTKPGELIVRVYRVAGGPTCNAYVVQVSNPNP